MTTKPKLPHGYRWLKVGDERPKGYKIWVNGKFLAGPFSGQIITAEDMASTGPYIAPIIKRPAKGAKLPKSAVHWALVSDYGFIRATHQDRAVKAMESDRYCPCAVIPCSTLTEARALVKKFNGRANK